MNNLVADVVKQVENDGGTMLLLTKFGSQLYGTQTPASDTDYQGVYLPSQTNMLMGVKPKVYRHQTSGKGQKNSKNDIDITITDFQSFLRRFHRGDIVTLDIMFAHTNQSAIVYIHPKFKEFLDKYIDQGKVKAHVSAGTLGYINVQASKYGVKGTRLGQAMALRDYVSEHFDKDSRVSEVINAIKNKEEFFIGNYIYITEIVVTRPGGVQDTAPALNVLGKLAPATARVSNLLDILNNIIKKYGHRAALAQENQGIDWKALSHALRASYEYMEYIFSGKVHFPFEEDVRELLIDVKLGKLPFTTVKAMLEQEVAIVSKLNKTEPIDTTIDREVIMFMYGDFEKMETTVDEFLATATKKEIDELEKRVGDALNKYFDSKEALQTVYKAIQEM